jgi:hypothetical protein
MPLAAIAPGADRDLTVATKEPEQLPGRHAPSATMPVAIPIETAHVGLPALTFKRDGNGASAAATARFVIPGAGAARRALPSNRAATPAFLSVYTDPRVGIALLSAGNPRRPHRRRPRHVELAIFGAENYGYRLGVLGVPTRIATAAAPLLFGILSTSLAQVCWCFHRR